MHPEEIEHRQVAASLPDGTQVEVDEGILSILSDFWRHGITTEYSCQGSARALAYVSVAGDRQALRLLSVLHSAGLMPRIHIPVRRGSDTPRFTLTNDSSITAWSWPRSNHSHYWGIYWDESYSDALHAALVKTHTPRWTPRQVRKCLAKVQPHLQAIS